jgi:hypothetical protein
LRNAQQAGQPGARLHKIGERIILKNGHEGVAGLFQRAPQHGRIAQGASTGLKHDTIARSGSV